MGSILVIWEIKRIQNWGLDYVRNDIWNYEFSWSLNHTRGRQGAIAVRLNFNPKQKCGHSDSS